MNIHDLNDLYIRSRIPVLLNKYKSSLELYTQTNNQELAKILSAVYVIETWHRNMIWRLFEYIFFIINLIMYALFCVRIRNVSIGPFQVKVSNLFKMQGIKHLAADHGLLPLQSKRLRQLFQSLFNCGKVHIISKYICQLLSHENLVDNFDKCLKIIAFRYAGYSNISKSYKYYSMLKLLING